MTETLKITTGGIQEIKIAPLLKETDKLLRQRSIEWDFSNPPEDAAELAKELIRTCQAYGGLGLSAVQIGKPYRVFCIGLGKNFQVCFNPKIISSSGEIRNDYEGCLSFPALAMRVKRPEQISVEFQMPDGTVQQHNFDRLTSRCFQHELDHLDGIVFTDKVSKLVLQRAKDKRKKFIDQIAKRRKQNGSQRRNDSTRKVS